MKITVKKGGGGGSESAVEKEMTKPFFFFGHSSLGFQWCHAFLYLFFFSLLATEII